MPIPSRTSPVHLAMLCQFLEHRGISQSEAARQLGMETYDALVFKEIDTSMRPWGG